MLKNIFLCFLCLFLSSCAIKNKTQSQSVFVVLKNSQIKFNDYGFLYQGKNDINLELYSASKALFTLKIADNICINGVCYTKKLFNKKFFNYEYYDDFLKDLILQKAIFNNKNKIINSCGFIQELKSKDYEIFYEVCDGKMSFSEKKSNIKFSITRIKN